MGAGPWLAWVLAGPGLVKSQKCGCRGRHHARNESRGAEECTTSPFQVGGSSLGVADEVELDQGAPAFDQSFRTLPFHALLRISRPKQVR